MRLTASEARRRFAAAPVVRLATVSAEGIPHLVPITFAVVGATAKTEADRIVFVVDDKPKSTTRLKRLANIAANPSVCVLADVYDDDWSRLWWARADGTARILTEDEDEDEDADANADADEETAAALDALAARYPVYAGRRPRGPVVAIDVSDWTGWAARDA
ncbi:TIGR03668 family PPOX class F420-dependent oxidoreductase [Actinoplanes sp. NPDC023714]|uniref:TIGR03668 family PPOX class F420-dependent oxidoreductase n=1 Tax=Actinoplanes sp. NPDC023714 TaxID=3154322 RepID=UPI0033C4147B